MDLVDGSSVHTYWQHYNRTTTQMWCDLRKPVTSCKIDVLSYWYHVKVWIILFLNLFTWISSDTDIKNCWGYCSKSYKNKEKYYDSNLLYFALQFHPLWHVTGFPRSHHKLLMCLLEKRENVLMYLKIYEFVYIPDRMTWPRTLMDKFCRFNIFISFYLWWSCLEFLKKSW